MFKKIAVILMAAAMTLSLAACSGGGSTSSSSSAGSTGASSAAESSASTSEGATTIQFWGHVNEAWNAAWDAEVEEFNSSQSDIVVKTTYFPYADFEAKMQTSLLSGGEGADIYETWGGWALDFVANDALSPVPEEFMAELIGDCYEPVIGAFAGSDGQYYGVPLEYNIEYGGMLVNKPRFEEAGLEYPTTWDEILDVARQTAKSNGDLMEMRGIDIGNDQLTSIFLSMILSQGGEYMQDGKIVFNTPEAISSMQAMVDWIKTEKLGNLDSLTGAAGTDVATWHFMGRDEAMIVFGGPWMISSVETSYGKEFGVDFDYIAQPFYGDTPAFASETGWGLCVPKNTQNADAAWTFAEYILEPENLLQHNITCGMIPPRKSVVNDPAYVEAAPYMEPLISQLDYGRFIGPFNSDVFKANLKQTYISLVTDDGTYSSVEEALIALEEKMNTDLKLA